MYSSHCSLQCFLGCLISELCCFAAQTQVSCTLCIWFVFACPKYQIIPRTTDDNPFQGTCSAFCLRHFRFAHLLSVVFYSSTLDFCQNIQEIFAQAIAAGSTQWHDRSQKAKSITPSGWLAVDDALGLKYSSGAHILNFQIAVDRVYSIWRSQNRHRD